MILKRFTYEIAKNRLSRLDVIQSYFGIKLPVLYLSFINTYAVGQYIEKWESSLDRFLRLNSIVEVIFDNGDIKLPYGWLYSPEELNFDLRFYPDRNMMLENYGVIRVGNIVSGGGLYLGVNNGNADSIFKMVWDHDSQPIKIADSIFEFINCLQINVKQSGLQKKVGLLFHTDPMVNFEFNESVKSEINALGKENVSTFSEVKFLSNLNQLFSDVRDRNFGIRT